MNEATTCPKCGDEVGYLEVFPGGYDLKCWQLTPEGRYLPTAEELARTWGAR